MMLKKLAAFFFPPKCVLCRGLLQKGEKGLCSRCISQVSTVSKGKFKVSFVARWTSLWYYKDDVRRSILRYKFYGQRSYGPVYAALLAEKLRQEDMLDFDILTYIPVSPLRRWKRGFDQMALLGQFVAQELGSECTKTLRKIRNAPAQSGIQGSAHRRANVLGAFQVLHPEAIRGKRILLLDDVLTTGATASECARILLTAGAASVDLATLAISPGKHS